MGHHFVTSHKHIFFLIFLSGMAALSWESIWQIKSSLALGVSAWGTALTLAITMGGMSIGALLMGYLLRNKNIARPLRIYGVLECIIGISGLFLNLAFRTVEHLDSWAYAAAPEMTIGVHITGIVISLGIPTLCMGATLPVLGLISRKFQTSIATLYGLNTLGAATGVLLAAFVLIPLSGITCATWVIASANIVVGIIAWSASAPHKTTQKPAKNLKQNPPPLISYRAALFLSFITGLATFVLEVSWFRSLTAAFMSTSEAFAIMLSCVLIALGLSAHLVPYLKKNKVPLGLLIAGAGILILLVTPLVERFDLFMYTHANHALIVFAQWFAVTFYVIGPPVLLLGVALPWILDDQKKPSRWGILYGLNACAAIIGAITTAWLFLPTIGFARTVWMVGTLVVVTGILFAPKQRRPALCILGIASLLIAVLFESGVGRTRVQGASSYNSINPSQILEVYEGPDVTVSAVEYESGRKILFIDGFSTTEQSGENDEFDYSGHYMPWMGHLPMLLHPDPQNALVIAFGTGQTANSVRKENPKSLDIVDINKNVFKLAHNFTANENVLGDDKVTAIVMDGRAYMRRTGKTYDVITLEPMPPTFSGVNALYSKEFYQMARGSLGPEGVIAQWLPFHLVAPYYGASIAKTFQDVFPNALLWIDPPSGTGILIGSANDDKKLGQSLPGFNRKNIERDLSKKEVQDAILLNAQYLQQYGSHGAIITDDNLLLSHGKGSRMLRNKDNTNAQNHELLNEIKARQHTNPP